MRRLVEQVIGIPILQVELPQWISGATVVSDEHRGIVLNTKGATQNVLIRRATLAHELGHLLYDPASALQNLRVDSERDIVAAADTLGDYVEQRANAFAIAFLAPPEAVRMLVQPPFDVEDVRRVMREFGIGPAAARFHIGNSHYNAYEVPSEPPNAWPSDEVRAQEDFTLDYFTPETTPPQRRPSDLWRHRRHVPWVLIR
jgi:Zn-dependent peptidase ImmA (M78 family)